MICCNAIIRLAGEAQIGIFGDFEIGVQEPKLFRQVDIRLQRFEVRQSLRVAVIILFGKNPVLVELSRLLGGVDDQLNRFLAVRRIAEAAGGRKAGRCPACPRPR